MTDFTSFSAFSYQLFILLSVILSKMIVSHFIHHEPLRFFQFYCQKLSDKVNKPQNSSKQQKTAGFISVIITLPPIVVILWMFESFVEVNFIWQALLLYFAIGSFGLTQTNKNIIQGIKSKQGHLAKQSLNPWVLRETSSLSSLGIYKASIEMQLLRTLQQGYTVGFIFIIFGPLTALSYRLLLEMHYCWNTKLFKYNYFGLFVKQIIHLMQWLPVRIFSMLLLFSSVGKNILLFWNLSRQYFFQLNNNIALLILALNLEVKLGGVALYDDKVNPEDKLRKPSFNDLARQPQITDIVSANNKIHAMVYISLFFLLLLAMAIEFIMANI